MGQPRQELTAPPKWGTAPARGHGAARARPSDPGASFFFLFLPKAAVSNGAVFAASPHRAATCSPVTSPRIKRELSGPPFQLKQYCKLAKRALRSPPAPLPPISPRSGEMGRLK